MAQLIPLYIRSTTAGMVWRIVSYKPAGKPAVVSAHEGRDKIGSKTWSCDLMNCRKFRRQVEGRATRRALIDTVRLLLLDMHAAGAIARQDGSLAAGSLDHAAT